MTADEITRTLDTWDEMSQQDQVVFLTQNLRGYLKTLRDGFIACDGHDVLFILFLNKLTSEKRKQAMLYSLEESE